MPKPAYHYTTLQCLTQIFDSGYIEPATAYIEKNEKPVVWFSTNPEWEETATKGYIDKETGKQRNATKQEMKDNAGDLIRIEVPLHLTVSIRVYEEKSGISEIFWESLVKVAKDAGSNIKGWRVSFKPIPIGHFIKTHYLDLKTNKWKLLKYNLENKTIDRG